MKNWIINLAGGWFGGKKIWDMLDGLKMYLTGIATMLTGISGLINEYLSISGAHNFATVLTFIEGIGKDPNWITLLGGFGIIAAAHKADKVIKAIVSPAITTPDVVAGIPADSVPPIPPVPQK